MLHRPDVLLIGAAGRNAGKTTLACELIRRLSRIGDVVGVKITTIHDTSGGCPRGGTGCGTCTAFKDAYCISKETISGHTKDTQRMRNAGADNVYWLRAKKSALEQGIASLLHCIPEGTPIVCESNTARMHLTPGRFIVVRRNNDSIKPSCRQVMHLADRVLVFEDSIENFPIAEIVKHAVEMGIETLENQKNAK